ncbi:MAG: response regulator, partial [Leptonema sp. (in: Bacteria)]|nr:response regulator [Leptonema sp. (in: bacteria)]
RMELESISFPLKEMLKSIIDLELVQAKRKDLNLKLDCANNLPDYVIGDAMRIRQVLLNLISNAIKFTERGGIAVQVNVSNDKQMIEFCVADTGIGIPESLKPMLFTPFRQADGSITRRFGGTGLGLAICRQIVEHMGGSIYLDESWHQGSRFVFKIPLQVSEVKSQLLLPENSEVLVTKSVFESVEKVSNSQGAVLLVEDNEINSIVANELLRSFGLTVDIASNGKEGVAKALANRYSIILMDLQMPIMDGYEATRIIRENKIETPIIAVTAHVLDSEIQKCFDNGMNDHVAKPIDPETLYTTLSKWISLPEKPDFNLVQKVKPISFELPGFDVESAVHRLDNDESLYLSLLQFFVRDHRDDAYHLERAIQSNELHQIRHIVHRLKGASANLSAQHILNILLRFDEAIETTGINLEILNPIINELKNEIHTSIPLIEKLLTKRQSTLKRKTESNKKVSWLDLDTLLSRQSLQAKDCFYQLTEQRHRSDSAVIKKIENAINHLDYSLARSLLAQVIIDTKNENHFLKGTV